MPANSVIRLDAESRGQSSADHDAARYQELLAHFVAMRHELERFLTARLGDKAAAEDVYQAAYLRIQSAAFKYDIVNPSALLYKIVANLANDYSRGQRRQKARDRQ